MITTSNLGALMGAPVLGPDDEKIGTVGQVFLDPESGNPNWMTVKTGLFGMKESFVPLDTAEWDHERVHIKYDKDLIKGAPRVDTDSALGQPEEAELYKYYGMSHRDDGERATTGVGSDDPTAASAYTRLDTPGGPSSQPGTPGSDYSDTGIGKTTGVDTSGTAGGAGGSTGTASGAGGTGGTAMANAHKGAHAADTEVDAPPAERASGQNGRSRMRRYEPSDVEAEDDTDRPIG